MKGRKTVYIGIGLVLCFLILGTIVYYGIKATSRYIDEFNANKRETICRHTLWQLHLFIVNYEADHGFFPASQEKALSTSVQSPANFCSCAGVGYVKKPVKGIDAISDYTYISWPAEAPVEGDWPIL